MAWMVKSSAFHHGGPGLVSGPCGIYGEESGRGTQSSLSTLEFRWCLSTSASFSYFVYHQHSIILAVNGVIKFC